MKAFPLTNARATSMPEPALTLTVIVRTEFSVSLGGDNQGVTATTLSWLDLYPVRVRYRCR
jgi:hypothetical protein